MKNFFCYTIVLISEYFMYELSSDFLYTILRSLQIIKQMFITALLG